ncbi:hypothetical protein [Luteococcus peritonei]|uniref:Sigma-70 family RNA polymerase sigma factor n=1 Tax=Luteococcus peritonei TaxID=88874 RepID=A0ABW4RVK7_9ACTN
MGNNPAEVIDSIVPPAMRELGRTISSDAEAARELERVRAGEDSSRLICHLVAPHVVNAVYKHGCLDTARLIYLYEVLVEHALVGIAAGHDWEHISKRASGWAQKLVYQRHSSLDGLTDVPSVTEGGEDNRSYRTSLTLVGTEFDAEVHDASTCEASREYEEAVDEGFLIDRACESITGRRVEQRRQQRVVILTLLGLGYTQVQVARMADVTDRTVRNEVVAAQDAVLDWARSNRRLRVAA